jgi:hypothetical protein
MLKAWPVPSAALRTANNGGRQTYSSSVAFAAPGCPGAVLISQRRVRMLYSQRRISKLIAPCRR